MFTLNSVADNKNDRFLSVLFIFQRLLQSSILILLYDLFFECIWIVLNFSLSF